MAMTLVLASFIFCMMVAPKFASVWNSMAKSTLRCRKLSALASAGGAVEPVVDDLQVDARGLCIGDDALLHLEAERDIALQVGKADGQLRPLRGALAAIASTSPSRRAARRSPCCRRNWSDRSRGNPRRRRRPT